MYHIFTAITYDHCLYKVPYNNHKFLEWVTQYNVVEDLISNMYVENIPETNVSEYLRK